jgi:hypothetical protein
MSMRCTTADVPGRVLRVGLLGLASVWGSCATVAPATPRFVVVYAQRNEACVIEVVRDTRSTACFVAVRCGRRSIQFVHADPEVCVP